MLLAFSPHRDWGGFGTQAGPCLGLLQTILSDAAPEYMSATERAALEQALERSLTKADAGELLEADEVGAGLRRP